MILNIKDQIEKLQKIRKGEIKEGYSLGIPEVDEYFKFKKGSFNVVLGHSNTGKTTTVLYLMLLYSVKHNFRWLIYSSENEAYVVLRKLVEFLEGVPINMVEQENFDKQMSWIDGHFKIIDPNTLYNYKKLLNLAEEIKKAWDYHGFMIDPYNSLMIDRKGLTGISKHDYDYQATSEMRVFCKSNDITIWLCTHAATEALRKTHAKDHEYAGHPMPPMGSDVEGGGKFINRSDDFLVIHRYTQHPTEWMYSMIHVRKIKDMDSGGRPTSLDAPIKMRSVKNNVGFTINLENMLHKALGKI
jgi:energy-coupling factor transporter ATP-binding protein EcfA2